MILIAMIKLVCTLIGLSYLIKLFNYKKILR